MEGALGQQDKEVAFDFFYNILQDGRSLSGRADHSWAIIDRDSAQLLVTEKMAHLDPCTMSEIGYRCFAAYFSAVSSSRHLQSSLSSPASIPLWTSLRQAAAAVVAACVAFLSTLCLAWGKRASQQPSRCMLYVLRTFCGSYLGAGLKFGTCSWLRRREGIASLNLSLICPVSPHTCAHRIITSADTSEARKPNFVAESSLPGL